MTRAKLLALLFVFSVAGLVALNPIAGTRAQEGTPVVTSFEFDIAPGVKASVLPVPEDPPSLYRLRFDAGVTYPFTGDPAISLVYVESGSLVLRVGVPVTVSRGSASGAAGESIAADTEFTAAQGDFFVLPSLASGEVRNETEAEVSVAVASLLPGGAEITGSGTPMP